MMAFFSECQTIPLRSPLTVAVFMRVSRALDEKLSQSLIWCFQTNSQWIKLSKVPCSNSLGHMWSQWELSHSGSIGVRFFWSMAVMTPYNINFRSRLFNPTSCYHIVMWLEKFLDHSNKKKKKKVEVINNSLYSFGTECLEKKHKKGVEKASPVWKLLMIPQTNSSGKTLPGLCFADHSVCWIHAE